MSHERKTSPKFMANVCFALAIFFMLILSATNIDNYLRYGLVWQIYLMAACDLLVIVLIITAWLKDFEARYFKWANVIFKIVLFFNFVIAVFFDLNLVRVFLLFCLILASWIFLNEAKMFHRRTINADVEKNKIR